MYAGVVVRIRAADLRGNDWYHIPLAPLSITEDRPAPGLAAVQYSEFMA